VWANIPFHRAVNSWGLQKESQSWEGDKAGAAANLARENCQSYKSLDEILTAPRPPAPTPTPQLTSLSLQKKATVVPQRLVLPSKCKSMMK